MVSLFCISCCEIIGSSKLMFSSNVAVKSHHTGVFLLFCFFWGGGAVYKYLFDK